MALIGPVKRTSIIVNNLNESVSFWKEVFELEPWWEAEVTKDHHDDHVFKLLGIARADIKVTILQSPGFDYGMVGLFEIVDPNLPSLRTTPPAGMARNEIALIFETDNIDEIRKRLKARDHPLVCEPMRVELEGYPPKIEMTLRDPNGVFINLIQTLHE